MLGREYSNSTVNTYSKSVYEHETILAPLASHLSFPYRLDQEKLELNPRERVVEALDHREPDRPPIDLGGTVSGIHNKAYRNLIEALKLDLDVRIDPRDVQQLAKPDEVILEKLGVDFRHVGLRSIPGPGEIKSDDSGRPYFVDEWGRNPNYYDMIDHPLKDATIDDLERYN